MWIQIVCSWFEPFPNGTWCGSIGRRYLLGYWLFRVPLSKTFEQFSPFCGKNFLLGFETHIKQGERTDMFCPVCGYLNPTGATYCQECGASLDLETFASAATPSLALPKGTTLFNGRYVIEKLLWTEVFSIAYKAIDTRLNLPVTVKECLPNEVCRRVGKIVLPVNISDFDFACMKQQFWDETRLLASLNHPGIIRFYDVFEENNTIYIVLEFLEGKTLLDVMIERGGVLEEGEAVRYILKVCEALEIIHKAGYLHRDIKPEGIMVCKDGRVVLIDFTSARPYNDSKEVEMDAILTPGYAPLEQYSSRARFGPPLDIYALGATLYHLLTGKVPPSAPDRAQGVNLVPPHQLNPKVSRQVSEAIMKAMEMNVSKRPQTVKEFVEALQGTFAEALTESKTQSETQKICRVCGTRNSFRANFCWYCGAFLGG
jgi:serine/threonine-protein kinase